MQDRRDGKTGRRSK